MHPVVTQAKNSYQKNLSEPLNLQLDTDKPEKTVLVDLSKASISNAATGDASNTKSDNSSNKKLTKPPIKSLIFFSCAMTLSAPQLLNALHNGNAVLSPQFLLPGITLTLSLLPVIFNSLNLFKRPNEKNELEQIFE